MTPSSSHRKRRDRDHKKPEDDSTTKVYFSNPKLLACYRNRRVVRSFRVDEGLWEAFKPVAMAKWGSVCKCIEELLSVVLHHDAEKVYLCNTVNPLNIEKIVIERNIRTRRKLVEETEIIEKVVVVDGKPEQLNKTLGMVADQWLLHPSREWRMKWKDTARQHPALSNAALVLSLSATAGWS